MYERNNEVEQMDTEPSETSPDDKQPSKRLRIIPEHRWVFNSLGITEKVASVDCHVYFYLQRRRLIMISRVLQYLWDKTVWNRGGEERRAFQATMAYVKQLRQVFIQCPNPYLIQMGFFKIHLDQLDQLI